MDNQRVNISGDNFATIINDEINRMLSDDKDICKVENRSDIFENELILDSYSSDYIAIKDAFSIPGVKCNLKLSKKLIFQRLALIDLFYGTNIVRMRHFGLEDLAQIIWDLCDDSKGNHSDVELVNKSIAFVAKYSSSFTKLSSNESLECAFVANYGLIKIGNTLVSPEAPSILSKYLFFLLQSNLPNNIGFPIYDSIVCKYAPRLAKKLGTIYYGCKSDMGRYTYMLSQIINVLENNNSQLWNHQNSRLSKFALLDHFLWRVGKAKDKSYSLLLTRQEYISYSCNGILPQRILQWQNINL